MLRELVTNGAGRPDSSLVLRLLCVGLFVVLSGLAVAGVGTVDPWLLGTVGAVALGVGGDYLIRRHQDRKIAAGPEPAPVGPVELDPPAVAPLPPLPPRVEVGEPWPQPDPADLAAVLSAMRDDAGRRGGRVGVSLCRQDGPAPGDGIEWPLSDRPTVGELRGVLGDAFGVQAPESAVDDLPLAAWVADADPLAGMKGAKVPESPVDAPCDCGDLACDLPRADARPPSPLPALAPAAPAPESQVDWAAVVRALGVNCGPCAPRAFMADALAHWRAAAVALGLTPGAPGADVGARVQAVAAAVGDALATVEGRPLPHVPVTIGAPMVRDAVTAARTYAAACPGVRLADAVQGLARTAETPAVPPRLAEAVDRALRAACGGPPSSPAFVVKAAGQAADAAETARDRLVTLVARLRGMDAGSVRASYADSPLASLVAAVRLTLTPVSTAGPSEPAPGDRALADACGALRGARVGPPAPADLVPEDLTPPEGLTPPDGWTADVLALCKALPAAPAADGGDSGEGGAA